MPNGWEDFIPHIENFYSKVKCEFTKKHTCTHSAIIGHDGVVWASSKNWPGLKEYEHSVEEMDGSATNVKVNELQAALGACNGIRNPTAAGIRMGGQKYVMQSAEEGVAQLTRLGGGGACVAKTKKAIIIGVWDKTAMMSTNQNQNGGDCALGVERLAKFMQAVEC